MPKIKTNRGAAKRFKLTKTGKAKHKKTSLRHYLSHKSPRRKRHLRAAGTLNEAESAKIRRLMPYG